MSLKFSLCNDQIFLVLVHTMTTKLSTESEKAAGNEIVEKKVIVSL